MADMITRCPQCATAFRITAAHLKLAQGSVRCGACFTIFNALENLSERSTQSAPASNLADDFLISDNMGLDDESPETNPEPNKSTLFERVEQAKAEPSKTEEADESWALALLSEEGLGELHTQDDDTLDEPNFRPFAEPQAPAPLELSADFLKATKAEVSKEPSEHNHQPVDIAPPTEKLVLSKFAVAPEKTRTSKADPIDSAVSPPPDAAGHFATALAMEHPELNADDLKDLHQALQQNQPSAPEANGLESKKTTRNSHLIERIELDALEVTVARRKGLGPQFWWSLGTVVTLLALVIQIGLIKMPQWRYDERFAPIYAFACQHITCPQEVRKDISKIHTKSLLVHDHPSQPGAFAVDAVLVNKAAFAQPFPRLILSFRNLQNQLINERIFTPGEYLGGEMAGEKTMPIKQEIRISLEILDPGKDAVSYALTPD